MTKWFRFYSEALHDPKVQRLAPELFKAWVNLLCVAAINGGRLPSLGDVAYELHLSEAKAGAVVASLAGKGLLDRVEDGYFAPHNWGGRQYKSDVSTERVKRFRSGQRNVSEAPPDTEAEAETDVSETQQLITTTNNKKLSIVEDVKEKRWTPPRHCAVSRDKKRVYIQTGTLEWDAYAADFRDSQKQEPQPNSHGGKWFKTLGEAAE